MSLIDDQTYSIWGSDLFELFKISLEPPTFRLYWEPSMLFAVPILLAIMITSLHLFNRMYRSSIFSIPASLMAVHRAMFPFCVLNSYGLFAVMTTQRLEVSIEASSDGENWTPYEFKYKPGDVHRRPPFILGHMPRLDWRMWFLPFSRFPNIPTWFIQFLEQIRKGNPATLHLLEKSPFPPNYQVPYLRVTLYDYKFSSPEELKSTRSYWTRTPKGMFLPFVLANEIQEID